MATATEVRATRRALAALAEKYWTRQPIEEVARRAIRLGCRRSKVTTALRRATRAIEAKNTSRLASAVLELSKLAELAQRQHDLESRVREEQRIRRAFNHGRALGRLTQKRARELRNERIRNFCKTGSGGISSTRALKAEKKFDLSPRQVKRILGLEKSRTS